MIPNKSLIVLNNTMSKYDNKYYVYNIEEDRWFPYNEYGERANDCSNIYTTRDVYRFVNNGAFTQINWPVFKERLYSLTELEAMHCSIVGKTVEHICVKYLIVAKTIDNEYLYKCSTNVFSSLASDMKIWKLANE